MLIGSVPFHTIQWNEIEKKIYPGESGEAIWQIVQENDIRIRMVEYSAGYKADHWCKKGHVIYCVEGEMKTELEDGRLIDLKKGMVYVVGDNCEAHRSYSEKGCMLFIVD
ncbi:MAG TPA: DHCW motif cupin fold protein [Flavitalea sp.]|nr:DHCW motif cupin fold protein [Flavitalea sp.]